MSEDAGGKPGEHEVDATELFERETEKPAPEPHGETPLDEEPEPPEEPTPRETVEAQVAEEVEDALVMDEKEGFEVDEISGTDFFSFDYLDRYEEVERYWCRKPYSYVSVLFDPEDDELLYHVNEPSTDEFEEYVRSDMNGVLRDTLIHEEPVSESDGVGAEEVIDGKISEVFNEYADEVDPGTFYKTRYYLLRDFAGYGKIDPMMHDRGIEDISCDGTGVPVYVYHRGYRDLETNVVYGEDELNSFVLRLAQKSDKHVSVAEPMVDASLPDGSRIQMTLGREVSTRGSNFTVRRFRDVPLTPIDLVRWGTFSAEQMAYFWTAIRNNMSLVFAGGTASGKTTSMNAVSLFIPRKSKVVTIEDTREITLPHDNWIQSVTRESSTGEVKSNIGMSDLLGSALRQRPEYLLVGEIRNEPRVAETFFQAMATGHTSYTTFHADSVETVLSRFGNRPLNVPPQMLRELDIVAVQKQVFSDGKRVRRNTCVAELGVDGGGDEGVGRRDIYRRNASEDSFEHVGDSAKMREIREMRGWSEEDLRRRLEERTEVIRTLVENEVFDYDEVVDVIRRFDKKPEAVAEEAEDGNIV